MLLLDGSYGEGGGQILRTSMSLAAMLGAPVRLERIRTGRPKPGLRPQHLTAVRALARITNAEVEGAELHSRELTFKPRIPQPGTYLFDVAEKTGSAGSVTLIAQALLPPLLKSAGPSTLVLRGGTHVPWSPNGPLPDLRLSAGPGGVGGAGDHDPGTLGLVSPGRRRGVPEYQSQPEPLRGGLADSA